MKPTIAIYGIKDRFVTTFPTYVHDHNLCLMQDGKITHYLQLERLSRRKYDNRLDLFIEDLLDNNLLDLPDDFDIVSVNNFVGNAFISKTGRLRIENTSFRQIPDKEQSAYAWFEKKQCQGRELNAYIVPHELAHIFSIVPFYGIFKDNSLLIHFDGGASISNFSAYIYKQKKLHLIEAHWDLSHLSKFFNDNALNFAILGAKSQEHTSVPGKLMGLAAYGSYSKKIEKWLLKNNYFQNIWDNYQTFFKKAKSDFNIHIKKFETKNQFLLDITATFQAMFIEEIYTKIKKLQNKYKTEYLYYSGGSALNIVANTKIVESDMFKDVFISPATNDSGLSIGAAAYLEWKKGNNIKIHKPYLNNIGINMPEKKNISKELIKKTAELLMSKKVIGIANGYGEAGPRALGNRSIIALPNDKKLSKKVSMYHKNREWYRPIAPIMLQKLADKVTGKITHHLSKFMLLNYKILPKYYKYLLGVIHIDGTARIQTLSKRAENPFMFDLLEYIWKKYQIYALINTSFNKRGEPIVHTKEDAISSAKKMHIDAIIINNKLEIIK